MDKPLTDSIETNKKIICESLKKGSSYVANYEIRECKGFRFFATSNKTFYNIGDVIIFENRQIVFSVIVPVKCEIHLLHNGEVIARILDSELDYIANTPGNYRVEAILARRKWIITNNIYVK